MHENPLPPVDDTETAGATASTVPGELPVSTAIAPVPAPRGLSTLALAGIFGAAAVVASVWVVGASWSLTQAAAPAVPVRAYVEAMSQGDVELAAKLDGTAAAAKQDGVSLDLLTNEAYALASDQATAYRIRGTEVRGDDAVVTVSYVRADKPQSVELELVKRRNVFLWFDAWRLEPSGMPTISVPTDRFGPVELSFGAESLGTLEEDTTFVVAPGSYDLSTASVSGFFDFDPTQLDVEWGANREVFLYPTLTELGVEQASAAVTAYVDACIASTSYEPDGCSFAIDNSAGDELTAVVWTLTKAPTFEFPEFSSNVGFIVSTTQRGSADFLAAYRLTSGETGIATAEDCEVWVDGGVTITESGEWVFAPYV